MKRFNFNGNSEEEFAQLKSALKEEYLKHNEAWLLEFADTLKDNAAYDQDGLHNLLVKVDNLLALAFISGVELGGETVEIIENE